MLVLEPETELELRQVQELWLEPVKGLRQVQVLRLEPEMEQVKAGVQVQVQVVELRPESETELG